MNGRQRKRQPKKHLSKYSLTRWRFFNANPDVLNAIESAWEDGAENLPLDQLKVELEGVEKE